MNQNSMKSAVLTIVMMASSFAYGSEALLIGVSDYPKSPLINPVNDVQLISRSLNAKGWKSKIVLNPTSDQLKEEVRIFYARLKNSSKPSIIYFSGHGLQFRGENYLLPVDILDPKTVLSKSMSITEIAYFSKDLRGPKIFIIDACRSSPFGKDSIGVSSGLNSQYAPPNSLIAYATAPGEVALDGLSGSGSPYARAFANSVDRYNSLDEVFKKTRLLTMAATRGKQLPWESSSLYQEVNLLIDSIGQDKDQSTQVVALNPQENKPSTASSNDMRPSVSEINYDSILAAMDSLKNALEKSPLSAFEKRSGALSDESDRRDFISTIEAEKSRYKSNPAGVSYAFITALQTGIYYPKCRKGVGIDPACGDFDRFFKFTPNLRLSLHLAKLAHSANIRSDKLAFHYMNGWGVDKDLLKAYELFESDKFKGGIVAEYWWTNINSMVQGEMNKIGYKVEVDGDFGRTSCMALIQIIGPSKCGKVVSKNQMSALIAKAKISIQ
jgi:hypothetical protein